MTADSSDVMTWFDLHTTAAPPCPEDAYRMVAPRALLAQLDAVR